MASLENYAKKLDFRSLMVASIISALSFVVGLFWKDAIKETIDVVVPEGEGLFYLYITAIIVTIVVVIVAYILLKTSEITKKWDDKLLSKLNKKDREEMKTLIKKAEKEK